MSSGSKDLFGREKELLEQARQLLEQCISCSIPLDEYQTLVQAYAALLKQISQLTRFSDKNQKRMNAILERLSRLVSPPLYRKITTGQEMVEVNNTRRVKLSIFYSDIKGFSWQSSQMEGEALSIILNSYLEEMTRIILKYGGTLDKYIGDAILVFFGDPDFTDDRDHALRCVQMAIEMRQRMDELQRYWYDLGYPDPLHVRMGISTGFVSVGNFGSSEFMAYTIIGTPVNLAARLQEAAREDQILISHETWGLVKDQIACSPAFSMELKGFYTPQLVHEVRGDTSQARVIEDKDKGIYLRYDPQKCSPEDLLRLLGQAPGE